MKAMIFLSVLLLGGLSACSNFSAAEPEGPFGLTKGMSWDDIKECCQIEKTAMVIQNVYALKLVMVPKPDKRFDRYYTHLSRSDGVFGISAGTEVLPTAQAHQIYRELLDELTIKYGSPTSSDSDNLVWAQPVSPLGLFRITLSKKDDFETSQVSLFYIFDNNETYQ